MEPHQPQFSTQIGRRRRPPTQSPAQRVCVGEEEQWSERALPNRAKRGIRNPRRRRPQWAGRDLDQPLRFCAPEMFCPTQGVTPVNGVRGKATMSTKCSSGAVPGGVLPNPSLLPAKPSEAGSPGRGGARERTQFSPPGGNGVEWTQGELARRAKRRWPGPLRRRAAMGKVTRRPQAAKTSHAI